MTHHLAAAALLLAPVAVQTPPPPPTPCLDRATIQGVLNLTGPIAVEALAERCVTLVPDRAFLTPASRAFVGRMRAAGQAGAAGSLLAFGRQMGAPIPEGTDEAGVTPFVAALIKGGLSTQMDAKSCGEASVILDALAPLPPENVGALIWSILVLAEVDKGSRGPKLCPA